jgi:hypothetical protein
MGCHHLIPFEAGIAGALNRVAPIRPRQDLHLYDK